MARARHALTEAGKARLRARWRRLTTLARETSPEALRASAFEMLGESAPTDDKGEAWTLFAFARLAFAWVKADAALRSHLTPALLALTDAAETVLDRLAPPASPPRRPRADIDG